MSAGNTNGPKGLGPGDIIALVTSLISILIAFATLMHAVKCSRKFMEKKKEGDLLTFAIASSYSPQSVSVPAPPPSSSVLVPAPPPAPPPPAKLHAPTRNHPSHSAEVPRLDGQETVVDDIDIRQHHSHHVLIYNDTRLYYTLPNSRPYHALN